MLLPVFAGVKTPRAFSPTKTAAIKKRIATTSRAVIFLFIFIPLSLGLPRISSIPCGTSYFADSDHVSVACFHAIVFSDFSNRSAFYTRSSRTKREAVTFHNFQPVARSHKTAYARFSACAVINERNTTVAKNSTFVKNWGHIHTRAIPYSIT
jgi:hypothetical protein